MTTRPQPNNATPQRLQLEPQKGPRIPFSSPMGEEVLSPTSPNASRSPPQHQIKLSQSRGGQENDTKEKWTLPSQRPTAGERKASQEKGDSKSKWPGLNVVTNFAKAPVLAQRAYDGHAKQDAGLGLKKQEARPIITSKKPSVETLGLGHQRSGRSLKSLGSKGRLGDLKRASSKWSNLSPSDRAVVIGISISPEELARQSASLEASPAKPDGLTEQYANTGRSPNMPTIVLTPAKEKAPWSEEEGEDPVRLQHRRIASSVYSQMPTPDTGGRVIDSATVPPIPPLPPDAQKHNAANHNKDSAKGGPPARILSTYTDIDEGESPDIRDEYRPSTGESQLRILTKKGSMDTLATRHRSEGWWNHIISPFFPKSPMTFKASPQPREPVLEASSPSQPSRQGHSLQEARQTFPPPPSPDGLKSGHTSWTDSDVDIDLEKKRLELDGFRDRSTLIIDEPQEDPLRESALLPTKLEGFGLAAEYYEACLYDMHSPTPYFECQNHVCLPSRAGPADPLGAEHGNAREIKGGGGYGPNAESEAPRQTEQSHNLAAQQAPTNRFSAAFHEAMTPKARERPMSDTTAIEDLDATPDVQEAHAAPVVRAPAPVPAAQPPIPAAEREPEAAPEPEPAHSRELEEPLAAPAAVLKETPAPTYTPFRPDRPPKRYVAVLPPEQPQRAYEQPNSPGPLSPGQQRQAPKGAIPLEEVDRDKAGSHPAFDTPRTVYYQRQHEPDQTTIADLYPPPRDASRTLRRREIGEKDALPPRPPKEHTPLTLPRCRNCLSSGKPQSKKRKWALMAIAAGLVMMIILVLVLVMTLTRRGDKTPIQSNWLNLTNFPPIPTGVSTIVQPDAVNEDPNCVQPTTMWSCAVPKEQQQSLHPNAPDQPNFRVEIVYQNGTNATANSTIANSSVSRRSYGHVANAVSAGGFVRDRLLRIRNVFSSNQYNPSPAPPSLEDQTFLGNTTDKNAAPFDGEYTPFFMSFESATKIPSRLLKRQSSNPDHSNDPFGNITNAIPPPDSNPDGTAAVANLYPFPTAQPLRLYDRGLDTEHYGFYTYFDRSIFLKSAALLTDSPNTASVPDDENGGAAENAASVRCTWAQTRFLVQIWTKKGNSATLLSQSANSTSTSPHSSSGNATALTTSSANNFTQPGSFPYPVTITLDRHGGDIAKKMVFCYGLDDREHINATQKLYQLEDRGVGGQLVNPARGPFGDVNVTAAQGGPGGIDGGSGGCLCKWQNFGTGV